MDDDAHEYIEHMLRYPVNRGRRWTADHDAYLCKHLPILGCRAVAYRLGRTKRAVYERASRLGVAQAPGGRRQTWTDAEHELLREWLRRAAAVLGRSERAVAARAQRLVH